MKIQVSQKEAGNTIVATLMFAMVIGIGMASYLSLTSGQNRAAMWSTAYNGMLPTMEAGVEDALTHVYKNTANMTADGWTQVNGLTLSNSITLTGNQYYKDRIFNGGRYRVAISQTTPPTIVAQAYTVKPLSTNEMARTLKVTTAGGGLFAKGLVAKGNIGWNGNIFVDSFDSQDPTASTGGRYDIAKRKDNGGVGSVNGNITMGGGQIFGKVYTGPSGTVSGGEVGDISYIGASGSQGIQANHWEKNLNLSFPDVVAPFSGGGLTPPSGSILGIGYTMVLGTGNYKVTSIPNGTKMIVTGDAVLYCTGSIDMQGQSQITIGTTGSLKLYVAGDCNLSGNGVVNNTMDASKFSLWGMPSCTSIRMHGNAAFTGTIYAPQADFSCGGGGNNDYDCVGAVIVNTVGMNGHFVFHYDENLGRLGGSTVYTVNSWNEI